MTSLRRFASHRVDPENARELRADHPALAEARSIFPTTVTPSAKSPRFLVSGHNNPKLGSEVQKGAREGWPIFHLSLEERATCPRSCEQWSTCYGNAMPMARRHTPDAEFMWLLEAEVATVARQLPKGLLIRLHTLGDFFSTDYVLMWARLLARFPQIHVFGYTARKITDSDPRSRRIAVALRVLTEGCWGRFSIRTSGESDSRARSIVVGADPKLPGVIVCPAQTGGTTACATCALCWAAPDKTIAFLRHGMTSRRETAIASMRARPPAPQTEGEAKEAALTTKQAAVFSALKIRQADDGTVQVSGRELCDATGVSPGSIVFLTDTLERKGLIEPVQRGTRGQSTVYRVIDVEARAKARSLYHSRIEMRRTAEDRRPPSAIVTRHLMGDPAPGRTPWAAP